MKAINPADVARIERHLAEARLPVGKTLANFEFEAVPMVSPPLRPVMKVMPVMYLKTQG